MSQISDEPNPKNAEGMDTMGDSGGILKETGPNDWDAFIRFVIVRNGLGWAHNSVLTAEGDLPTPFRKLLSKSRANEDDLRMAGTEGR